MSAEMEVQNWGPRWGASLQWGRAQMSAEIQVAALSQSIAALSSMGPRSDERGNMRTGLQREPAGEDLQWGRAQMSAEMEEEAIADYWEQWSSMGPRSDERGNFMGRCAN